jgi:two-component system nitrate/nitrite response regulator NarL
MVRDVPEHFGLALPLTGQLDGTIAAMPTTVLVIDDDVTFRELAIQMLEGMGLSVVGEADTVEAAGAAARNLRPQAALLDIALPDGNGITLAAELAALPWAPRIVLTSNDPGAATQAVARSAGAVAFIAKQDLPDDRLHALLTARPEPQ